MSLWCIFSQLFGEVDPDEDVSPDAADPEQVGDAGQSALESEANDKGNISRVSTRGWAENQKYDPKVSTFQNGGYIVVSTNEKYT